MWSHWTSVHVDFIFHCGRIWFAWQKVLRNIVRWAKFFLQVGTAHRGSCRVFVVAGSESHGRRHCGQDLERVLCVL